ncbi:plasmoredoxin, putative [Plasmodium vivax]|uniref:Thioredoxin-like redox-active protein, putative n=6 Tax=Plasmodium vivax TaxID=5855 RepID=A5KB53_PLAVS|nr:thioredoxin-like redox-active protein, putative [Plasmodium vivax]KMZ80755.1 thioredoxin-like redox-active protein [Plasmodium vivax India VII]KMZ86832.1 thioredoxin-like redox-active protein [Plasmodium vivax Brazil I]KMZ93262.1 thioredoxin-like redox-active protein [Plasmodium vivax Mauritania I]KMZ99826.1 thioredoxin-like redox-active protein [Plasmodium vivax North Korean]AAF99466.1 PV1H14100_P [Plasmodium vivax]|eukprot:XP_001613058.1 thioredoxin-like redox-active protein [Plasmodium vivax Sal-1]
MKCQVDRPVTPNEELNGGQQNVAKNYIPHLYQFQNNEMKKIDASYFDNKYLGLFFGASWCRYCVTFIQKINFFKKNFPFIEIIYIPFDKTYNDYIAFLKGTDFYSLPFDNYLYVCKKFNVQNLPSFMIIAPNNNVLVKDAVQLIKTDAYVANFKSLVKNYTIHPNQFKFGNRFFDLFCA